MGPPFIVVVVSKPEVPRVWSRQLACSMFYELSHFEDSACQNKMVNVSNTFQTYSIGNVLRRYRIN